MTIENKNELTESDQEPEVFEVEPYVVDALKAITLPQQKQGGCTTMPRNFLVSADDLGFCWNIDSINEIVESSQEFAWGTKEDLAHLFGRVILSLRAGRSITVGIKKYPIITKIAKYEY